MAFVGRSPGLASPLRAAHPWPSVCNPLAQRNSGAKTPGSTLAHLSPCHPQARHSPQVMRSPENVLDSPCRVSAFHVGWPQSFGAPHQQAEARMVHKRVEVPLQSKIYNRRQTRDVPPSPTPGQWCAVTEAKRPALTLWVGLENKLFKQQVPNRRLKPFEHELTMFPSFNTHCKRMVHHCSINNRRNPNHTHTQVAQ